MTAEAPSSPRAPVWYLPAGIAIGLAGALCGIGGGVFAGPLLHATRGLPLRRATASALPVVLATTAAATSLELVRPDSLVALDVALPLAAGALLGAWLGFFASRHIGERRLKGAFALVLFLAGMRVIFFGPGDGPIGASTGALATLETAFVVGIAGGFLTPLFGVGGGLVMVPALYVTLGWLGFNGARACSLAAGAVAAVQSLWLHSRARNVAWGLGTPLALGAVAGAVAAVFAVRIEGFATAGRVLLGLVLLGTAGRFALELRRGAAPSGGAAQA